MDLSVVIPLLNEVESIGELVDWLMRVCEKEQYDYELILIDDGSNDGSWELIEQLSERYPVVKGIRFRRNYGKSAALNRGFAITQGDVVITMDADLQDSPDEIPELVRMIREEGNDLVSGWKKRRHDPLGKTLPSKLFNATTRKVSGIKLHDFNCGLKAYRSEVVKQIEIFGEMHRYIPLIAKWAGYGKISEKIVEHRARKYGETKFGLERFIRGYLDLLSISFVAKFGKRPMHLFGSLGTILFVIGFGIFAYLAYAKFAMQMYRMTDRPIFYLALLAMVLGTQLFMTGFLAEMLSRSSSDRNKYAIAKTLRIDQNLEEL